eukprot:GHRR01030998.1.p1 GENE.GHRR01030998.1~~GHRR01030998.1.p1  ORF type:complete len:105 (+),score=28.69 GHRR01030998.1:179-493(+)
MWGSRAATWLLQQESNAMQQENNAKQHDTNAYQHNSHRRSRSWHSVDSLADLALPLSISETVERVAKESVMVLGLAFNLWSYLGVATVAYVLQGGSGWCKCTGW